MGKYHTVKRHVNVNAIQENPYSHLSALLKLRTGNLNRLLTSILQIEHEYSTAVMKLFKEDVLPHRLGIAASTRDDLKMTTDNR